MITSTHYILCFCAGILGISFHIFAIKLPSLQRRAKVANTKFSLKDYFADDWVSLGASIITVLIAILALDELLGYRPNLLGYIKYFFFFVGFTGSSILVSLLGKTDKAINAIIDTKTDIADKIKK